MIGGASDEALIGLGRHVGFDVQSKQPPIDPSFWDHNRFRLFITHLAEHKKFAGKLQEELREHHISGFVAHNDIEPTKEWQNEIELALQTADAMVALMHEGFHASNWTDQEIGNAMGRDLLIIPVKLGEEPYGFIGKYQALPDDDPKELSAAISEILIKHKLTSKAMAEARVAKFASSDSYANAKKNVDLLEEAVYWDENLQRRVESAIESNSQISDAWGVAERVRALLTKK